VTNLLKITGGVGGSKAYSNIPILGGSPTTLLLKSLVMSTNVPFPFAREVVGML